MKNIIQFLNQYFQSMYYKFIRLDILIPVVFLNLILIINCKQRIKKIRALGCH